MVGNMKRTFKLTAPGKDDARVRDKIRHEINKYAKRERRKALPEGGLRWDFTCAIGPTEEVTKPVEFKALGQAIEAVAEEGAVTAFVSIQSRLVKRSPRQSTAT